MTSTRAPGASAAPTACEGSTGNANATWPAASGAPNPSARSPGVRSSARRSTVSPARIGNAAYVPTTSSAERAASAGASAGLTRIVSTMSDVICVRTGTSTVARTISARGWANRYTPPATRPASRNTTMYGVRRTRIASLP